MENSLTKKKLNEVVSMLEGRTYDTKDSKLRLEMAKLKLMKNDPGFEISQELGLINRGKFGLAMVNFLDRKFIMPTLLKVFTRK